MKLLKPGEPCPCCGEPIPDGLPGETMILLSRIAELQDLRNLTSVVKCEDCEHQKKTWRKDGRMKNGGELDAHAGAAEGGFTMVGRGGCKC